MTNRVSSVSASSGTNSIREQGSLRSAFHLPKIWSALVLPVKVQLLGGITAKAQDLQHHDNVQTFRFPTFQPLFFAQLFCLFTCVTTAALLAETRKGLRAPTCLLLSSLQQLDPEALGALETKTESLSTYVRSQRCFSAITICSIFLPQDNVIQKALDD